MLCSFQASAFSKAKKITQGIPLVFSRDFLQYWGKQVTENLLWFGSSLLGQDGHELSYEVFFIINPFSVSVKGCKLSVIDRITLADFF